MNTEKAMANEHALTSYAREMLPQFTSTLAVINGYVAQQTDETLKALRMNAPAIRSLYRLIDDYSKAMADLKKKIDFCVMNSFDDSPEFQHEFKIQSGARSIKCDSRPSSMTELMERYVEAGFSPAGLFSQCTAITAKKAAEAFGLSELALLEAHGDLFETHVNMPSVKMV